MEVGFYMVERFNRQVGRYGWTKTKTKLTTHQKLGVPHLVLGQPTQNQENSD